MPILMRGPGCQSLTVSRTSAISPIHLKCSVIIRPYFHVEVSFRPFTDGHLNPVEAFSMHRLADSMSVFDTDIDERMTLP